MYKFIKSEHLSFRLCKIKGDSSELIPIAMNALSVVIGECDLNKNTTNEFIMQKVNKAIKVAKKNFELTGDAKFTKEFDYLVDLGARLPTSAPIKPSMFLIKNNKV